MTNTLLTNIGYATKSDIYVRGRNLSEEILDKYDFVDFCYLLITGHIADKPTSRMLNVIMIALCDHGLTPSAIAARLTYLGEPDSIQGAISAGLLGAGSRYLGAMETCCDLLTANIGNLTEHASVDDFEKRAAQVLDDCRSHGVKVTGVGHPVHTDGDPRVAKLRQVAKECGFYAKHWKLMEAIESQFAAKGRPLPLNAVGAIGATIADMGLDSRLGRGLAIIARSAGLLAHLLEERSQPIGQDLWDIVLREEAVRLGS